MDQFDVIIVGGGPAGLSAALILGRSRRSVLVFDNEKPRNRFAAEMHGYLTRDGIEPLEFLQIGREQLEKYDVTIINNTVNNAKKANEHFEVTDSSGQKFGARRLLLATGMLDSLPPVESIEQYYGKSVHHCPYCDGWEKKNQKIAVYAQSKAARKLPLSLLTWSKSVILFTNGKDELKEKHKEKLESAGVKIYTQKIIKLEGEEGQLHQIILDDGTAVPVDALFFSTRQDQRSVIARNIGCLFNEKGHIECNKMQMTSVEGIYVAGDAAEDMQFVIVAAAEGAKAGVAINKSLQKMDLLKLVKE